MQRHEGEDLDFDNYPQIGPWPWVRDHVYNRPDQMHLPAKIVQIVDEQSRIGQDDDNLEQVDFNGIQNKNNAVV